jgi:ligand-binding sensor domain-containing protein/signal transduction histidine kinase
VAHLTNSLSRAYMCSAPRGESSLQCRGRPVCLPRLQRTHIHRGRHIGLPLRCLFLGVLRIQLYFRVLHLSRMRSPTSRHHQLIACIISLAVCLICLLHWPVQAEQTQFGHEVWQTEQGLPQNTVQAVLQTRDGYLWLGTKAGLARFDGLRFTVFDKQNTAQLPHNQIRGLFEDSAGRLWISTPGALVQFKQGRFTAFTTSDGLSSNNIWSVYEDRVGNLWVATVNGLNRYRDGQFTSYTTGEGLSHNSIETLLEDRAGALWIGTADGLTCFKDGAFKVYTQANGLAGNTIKTLLQDNAGRLWIGTSEGLSVLADGKFQTFTTRNGLAHDSITTSAQDSAGRLWFGTPGGLQQWRDGKFVVYTTRQGLPDNHVGLLHPDRDGGLWVATNGGLARFWNDGFEIYSEREGLSSNLILSLCEDREGNLWVGTEAGGLNLLKGKKFTTHTTRQGLSANLVKSIYEDRTGNLWVGTQAGGLNLFKQGQWTSLTTKDGLASNDVQAVCDDHAGNLWLGTTAGLNRLRRGVVTTFTTRDGLSDDYIRSLHADRAGNLWIGTRRGLTQLKDGKFTAYTMLDGLPSDYVGALCESRDGSLWIGTLGGLSRFKDGEFINYTTTAGLSSEVVIALYEDADGSLWVGTHGGGLNRCKDGKFTQYTVKDGLPDEVIYHILEDGQGFLWMSCNKGIIRLSRKELEARQPNEQRPLKLSTYGTADGMETRECSGGGHPAGWKTRDGKLWFATIKGVAMIDPAHLRLNNQPPPVVIEQVAIDEETFGPGAPLELPPDKARFEFYYTGLSFSAPQQVAFKYKLEGFDPDWIEAGTRRVASYTNIPAGRYRFRVLACNNDGIWNETGAAFDFYLKPHFYETYWFYGLCALSLALVAAAWYRARVRRIEREFSAVLAERTRIAREIHDTLAQGFAGISVQLELVTRLLERAPQTAKTHLEQARALVRESLAEARRSVWDLRSQALAGSDLPAALAETAKRLVAGTAVQAQVQVSGTYRQLSRDIEDNLLRIGQEAMTNAIKHAQATQLRVELKFEPKQLCLSVRDDGCGFDCAAQSNKDGHFGLLGMRERVAQLGGHLIVNSRLNEGTEIMVEVPISG